MPTADERRQIKRIAGELEKTVETAVKRLTVRVAAELGDAAPRDSGNLAEHFIPAIDAYHPPRTPTGHAGAAAGRAAAGRGTAQLAGFDLAAHRETNVTNPVVYGLDTIIDDRPGFVERAIRRAIRDVELGL